MNLKKIRARKAAERRHRQLLRAAEHVVSRHIIDQQDTPVDPAAVVAVAFGRYELRITEDEARDYLNAVHAERGYPLRTADPSAPEAGA